ncbi:hypothetical protein J3B02_006076, partial [Coemansia erecta]
MPFSDSASEQTLNVDSQDTAGLYTVLGVTQDSTATEIKRAYRRLALQYHPDRNPGAGSEFVRIQYAYDVLSDERKRRIYDRYGEIGIQMAGRMGGELLDPQVTNLLSIFALLSALVSCLFIAFFALLAKRVDHVIEWSYKIVFIPLWVVDFAMVAGVVFVALARSQYWRASSDTAPDPDPNSNNNVDDDDDDGDDEEEYNAINDDDICDAGYQDCRTANSTGGYSGSLGSTAGRGSGTHRRGSNNTRPSYSSAESSVNSAAVSAIHPATDSTPLLSLTAAQSTERHRRRHNHRHRSRRSHLRTLKKLAESQLQALAKVAPTAYIILL